MKIKPITIQNAWDFASTATYQSDMKQLIDVCNSLIVANEDLQEKYTRLESRLMAINLIVGEK